MKKIKAIGLFVVCLPAELVMNVITGVVLGIITVVCKSIATVKTQVFVLQRDLSK